MARQVQRTARKDYPAQGIVKGDRYWFAQVKTGPRSSRTIRSKTPIPQSAMTTSAFKSGWYGVQESWAEAGRQGPQDASAMRDAAEAIQELGQEASNSFDNMPEGLQQGDSGQMLENRRDEAERIADELDSLADQLEALEEPEEPGDSPEEEDDPEGYEAAQTAHGEAVIAYEEWESERDDLIAQADDLLNEMPE